MKKIYIISLIITFHATQYTYLQAACLLCDQTEGIFNRAVLERPEPEEMESMFDQLALSEKIELIDYTETYKLKYMSTEFIYVSLYDENIFLLVEQDGSLLGAINQYKGKKNIILPHDIQPALICMMTCFLFFSQSAISVIACPLVPIARIRYPSDQELHEALSRTCSNGISGILRYLACSGGFCYEGLY